MLAREHRPRAAEPGLNLVSDEHDAMIFCELLDRLQVAGRRHDEAALALDRLGDDRCDIVRADLGEDRFTQSRQGLLGALLGALGHR